MSTTMRALRFHGFGEPAEVLQLDEVEIPSPGPGHIRVRVHSCGLNPADWALCRGLSRANLPRGIGLDVSGMIDAVGEGVTDVAGGDQVLGVPDYAGCASAGAADTAILTHWTPVPPGLDLVEAAALPMAVETAVRYLDWLGVTAGQTLLVNGGGTMIGFAAVQIGLLRGARIIAVAGETLAGRLRALGATVTPYGEGLVGRVRAVAGAPVDLVFDTVPVNLQPGLVLAGGVLADLVEIAGDPRRVITCADAEGAAKLGVRTGLGEKPSGPGGAVLRYDKLGEFAQLAAEGRFVVPIARVFALEDWREALALSLSGRAHGKLIFQPAAR